MSSHSPILQVITTALRKSARYVGRDFVELAYLQSSLRGSRDFATKSISRLEEKLIEALHTAHPDFEIIAGENRIPADRRSRGDKMAWYIQAISGSYNLERALPFFAIVVVAAKITPEGPDPIACIVEAPMLGESFSAEKSRGAWCEAPAYATQGKQRIRVAQKSADKENLCLVEGKPFTTTVPHCHVQHLATPALSLAYMAAGRADAVLYEPIGELEEASWLAGSLLVAEAGGKTAIKGNRHMAGNAAMLEFLSQGERS